MVLVEVSYWILCWQLVYGGRCSPVARKFCWGGSFEGVYYLTIAKYSREILVLLLKTANTAKVLLSGSFNVYSIL